MRGPAVTPGYYKRPDLTAAAFDEEGFYRVGDLVKFVDPANPAAGLGFAGRLSENFKLMNGSWVATGELRASVVNACMPLISDVVLAGADRDDIRVLMWPAPSADRATLVHDVKQRLAAFNAAGDAATRRIAAFHILDEAASMGDGEITDKGYINQRRVLQRRSNLVDALYGEAPDEGIHVVSCTPD